MDTDLIALLRSFHPPYGWPKEAADALEAQKRQIAELETKVIDDRKVMALNLALIEKKAWRIAELEAALKPFADVAEEVNAINLRYRDIEIWVAVGDLRAARAALEKKND